MASKIRRFIEERTAARNAIQRLAEFDKPESPQARADLAFLKRATAKGPGAPKFRSAEPDATKVKRARPKKKGKRAS